jgi:hypothetical protein
VTFFICAVPVFVFYATGYRYNFLSGNATITATGGLYVTVGSAEGEVYLNELPVRDLRVFRNAIYIQNVTPGMQRLHVQAPGLHTWVKELPVYPYIVTEAEAFALPQVPQVRPITQYETSTGSPVMLGQSLGAIVFAGVSTTIPVIATTSRATSTLVRNSEYDFVVGLFATTSATSTTLFNRVATGVSEAFQFSSDTAVGSTTLATTTTYKNDFQLSEQAGEIIVTYLGSERSTPYYFCVPQATLASTTELYGAQVMRGVALVLATAGESIPETSNQNRICRPTITIDRQNQPVIAFEFLPGDADLVVLHRADGIFVVEIDDRSWQNTQSLYPYPVDEMVVENGRLYIKQNDLLLELLTELPVVS